MNWQDQADRRVKQLHQVYIVDGALSSIYIISSTIAMSPKYIFSRKDAVRAFQAPSPRKPHGRCGGYGVGCQGLAPLAKPNI
jgi:hypothetical protein